jgi:chain length determinant protein EpsF
MLAIFVGILLVTLIVSLLIPKRYMAQASVVVDSSKPDLITGGLTTAELDSGYVATQVDVLTSHNVALKVVDKLRLDDNPAIISQFRSRTGGIGSIRDWIAQQLAINLEVVPSRLSSVLNIAYYARDPRDAATIANAFAEAYIQTDLELKKDVARRQASWFQQQLQDLRKTLESSQQRLSDYQRDHGILAGSENRLDVESARLTEVAGQLVTAQADLGDALAKLRQMHLATNQDHLEQLPDVLSNSLLQSMKGDLTRAEVKFADVSQRVAPNHPEYLSAQAEINKLKDKLRSEIATATGSIERSAEIAQQRVSQLKQALDDQKNRIIQLQQQHNDMDVLTRDVQSAQHTYESSIQRTDTLGLEGRNDQSTVAMLDVAVAPLMPARPRIVLNLALATVLGALLAVSAAFAAERLDRRVRTTKDLLDSTQMLVLGEIPRLLTATPKRA